jgi:hypothetical protein
MNLAEWLQGDHEPPEQLRAVESLCRAVAGYTGRGSLVLDPARIPVSGGECRPEEGKGTPPGRYRAPETPEGQAPGPQAQVYTVGVLSFEILSGRPFEVRGGPLLRDVRPDLPRDFSDAVQACLEMDAEWRPKDVSYVLGQVEGLLASGSATSKPSARATRTPSSPSAVPRNPRRGGPAPRTGPLLAFAVVALAVSLASAVYRLRQPSDATPIAPVPSTVAVASPIAARPAPDSAAGSPVARPTSAAAVASDDTRRHASPAAAPSREPAALAPSPAAARPPSVVPAATPAAREPAPSKQVAAVPVPATPAPVVPAATTPAPPPAPIAAPTPAPAAAPAEPAGPAAVTSVSPPVLRRGAPVLVDVHGVGFRSEHQVRTMRGKEAARGIDVVRQRYVSPTLLQVLLKVDATAAPGAYSLFLVDAAGQATNLRPFEVAK